MNELDFGQGTVIFTEGIESFVYDEALPGGTPPYLTLTLKGGIDLDFRGERATEAYEALLQTRRFVQLRSRRWMRINGYYKDGDRLVVYLSDKRYGIEVTAKRAAAMIDILEPPPYDEANADMPGI